MAQRGVGREAAARLVAQQAREQLEGRDGGLRQPRAQRGGWVGRQLDLVVVW